MANLNFDPASKPILTNTHVGGYARKLACLLLLKKTGALPCPCALLLQIRVRLYNGTALKGELRLIAQGPIELLIVTLIRDGLIIAWVAVIRDAQCEVQCLIDLGFQIEKSLHQDDKPLHQVQKVLQLMC